MKRNTYYPVRVADQIIWLENWRNKLGNYATALGLSAGQVTAGVADARWLVYVLQSWLGAVRTWSMACTDAATAAQTGEGAAALALPVFTPPTLPEDVAPVAPGALNRTFALVQIIKDSAGYTEAIGTDLGVVGAEQTGPDLETLQPVFKATRTAAGVNIPWNWGGYSAFLDMIEIQVDRADGKGWVPLTFDTTPGYVDTCPQPATLTKWKYRGIYRVGDQQVGQWSAEVSVTVGP